MEEARESLDSLEDYSVSQTSLDDVFIHFASQQKEDVGLCSDLPDIVTDGKEMVSLTPLLVHALIPSNYIIIGCEVFCSQGDCVFHMTD